MTSEELIHIKLEYDEAIQSKKDVLSSEAGLLKVANAIKTYHLFRTEELKIKLRFLRKIRELKTSIGKLQQVLPKLKIPAILKKGEEIEETPKLKREKKHYDDSLETQLREIQDRLKEIE